MTTGVFRFGDFELDSADRQLRRDGASVELSARYFDALALMVAEAGRLVTKDRFMDEVWRGIPVTDEALTQCIRSLRKALDDDAGRPRFIETVPKHGYRFVAAVEQEKSSPPTLAPPLEGRGMAIPLLAAAAMIGGGLAGLLGGIFYGLVGASQPLAPGMGAISVLLVLMCLCILVGMAGGLAVGLGVALGGNRGMLWSIGGGALGGLLIGAIAKLLGLDAFTLLLGQSPGNITGAVEGMVLGGATGLAVALAGRCRGWRGYAMAAAACGIAGAVLSMLGGRLMGGSLALLAERFPESRLRLDQFGALFGEAGFGTTSQAVTSGLEAALFGSGVAIAMTIAGRQIGRR